MFSSLGWPEIGVLILVALFIFGPDKLPGAVKQAGSALRGLKNQITGARRSIKEEFGDSIPDFDPAMLNPKAFVRKHLWEDDDESSPTATPPKPKQPATTSVARPGPAKFDPDAT